MGDVLVDQIPGGLTVMSSIVPPRGSDGSRRRMSPTQSPYFRVLEKGERLPFEARPCRRLRLAASADDGRDAQRAAADAGWRRSQPTMR